MSGQNKQDKCRRKWVSCCQVPQWLGNLTIINLAPWGSLKTSVSELILLGGALHFRKCDGVGLPTNMMFQKGAANTISRSTLWLLIKMAMTSAIATSFPVRKFLHKNLYKISETLSSSLTLLFCPIMQQCCLAHMTITNNNYLSHLPWYTAKILSEGNDNNKYQWFQSRSLVLSRILQQCCRTQATNIIQCRSSHWGVKEGEEVSPTEIAPSDDCTR